MLILLIRQDRSASVDLCVLNTKYRQTDLFFTGMQPWVAEEWNQNGDSKCEMIRWIEPSHTRQPEKILKI